MDVTQLALTYGPMAALLFYAASVAITKFFAQREGFAESSARVDVITMLTERVRQLEESQVRYQKAFEEERAKRMAAEDNVATLTLRVALLESQIRGLGHEPR